MSFWGELKRRNVYKVGVAYAIVAWLLIQGASIIFPHLNLPSWVTTFVIVILIIGFPLALLLAWAYEVTPEGIKRTKEIPLAESITHLTGKKLNYIVIGLLILAVAYILIDKFYLDRRAAETTQAPAMSEVEEGPKTIAVLPFVNLSSDPEQEYFVDGLSEELLNNLTQISDLRVTSRTSSFSFKGTDKKVQEIANELGVAHILEGSVRKAGKDLRITAQLIRAKDDFHLWSKTYDRELKDIFEVQEDIAKAVADELKISLGIGKTLKQLGGTDNVEAYELYLVAKGQTTMPDLAAQNRALKAINEAITLDPEFALAWAYKSQIHNMLSIFVPSNRAPLEQDAALIAVRRAIELEPNLAEAYSSLGSCEVMIGNWIDAELAFRKMIELTTEPLSGINTIIVSFYSALGFFKRSNELLEEILQNDPLNKEIREVYIINLTYLGEMKRAEEEYERCKILFGDQSDVFDDTMAMLRLVPGDFGNLDWVMTVLWDYLEVKKEPTNSPEEVLSKLRRVYVDSDNLSGSQLVYIMLGAAYLGDHELAMDALEKSVTISSASGSFQWVPLMKDVRQTSKFKQFVKETGLVDYWNEFGWPDICHPLDNDDFECD